jgi:hypothetical protein
MKLCLSALVALAGLAPAGPGGTPRRFEYLEDFEEEPAHGTVPAGWERVVSPAHPAWNRIEVVRDPAGARSGERYLRLATQGGSTALQMQKKIAWSIDPERSYRLSALVRLTATTRNTATVSVSWLNRRFEVLDESVTPPVSEPGGWRELSIDLPAVPRGTMWAVIRLSFEGGDVRGECCFDRLALTRPPRLRLLPADRTLPVFDPSHAPRFTIVARELAEGRHEADLRLRGADGVETVLRRGVPVRDGAAVPFELPALAPGAYTLVASVSGPDRVPIDRECPVLVTDRPWLASPRQVSLFGGSFDPFVRDYTDARGLAELAGFHRARVTLWHRAAPGERPPPGSAEIFEFVRRLSEADSLSVVGRIDTPPANLFPDVDPSTLEKGTAAFLEIERKSWEPQLRTISLRYREFVPLWQPGGSLVPTADLFKTFDGERVTTIEVDEPGELLRRLVAHAAAGANAPPAFIPVDRLLDADGFPKPAFLVLRAANGVLPGAKPRPELLPLLGPPVRAAFEKDGRAVLVLWTDAGEVEREFNLGPEAEVYPPLGAPRLLIPGERLRVGPMPLFIGKVDPSFLETQLSLRLVDPADPGGPGNTLPLRTDPISRILKFRNRSPLAAITNLRVRIQDPLPPGWIVRPLQERDLAIPPKKELSHEITIILPPTEEEGDRPLKVVLDYSQDGRVKSVEEKLSIRVVPQIVIDVKVADVPGIDDERRVTIRFSNATARRLTLVAAVRLPDRPEQAEPLGTLEPGAPAERALVYQVHGVKPGDPAPPRVEILCEESGGERLHARKVAPLR